MITFSIFTYNNVKMVIGYKQTTFISFNTILVIFIPQLDSAIRHIVSELSRHCRVSQHVNSLVTCGSYDRVICDIRIP